jgi:hypothetical protein
MASQTYKILISAKDKASASFKSLNKVAGTTGKLVGGLAKGVATATVALTAASVAVAAVARSSFEFADAIGKVSTRTGIATDTVQAFQIAAVESGSSVEIANKSLEKFTRSVGDAQRGLKTQADIFRDLGVSIEDANGNTKTMDVLLREVSDGMAGLQSQSEKATVAANLFGRAGIQIVDVLDNGGAAFDAYIDKAREYGLILSEEGIRKSEKFNDTLAFITRQFKTATAAISIAFLPILQNLATSFKEVTATTVVGQDGVMKFGESIRDIVLKQVDGFIRGFGDFLDAIHNVRKGLVQFAVDVERKFLETELATLKFRKNMDILGLATETFDALIRATSTALDENSNKMKVFNAQNKSGGNAVRKFADDLETYFVKVLGMSDEEVKNLLDSYNGMITGFKETDVTDIAAPLEKFRSELNEFSEQTFKDNIIVKGFKDAEDALLNFVETGDLNFKKMVDSMIKELIRLQIRMTIIKPFFNAFETAGGFGKGGLMAGFGALFGGGKAGGGAVKGGTPYLVGEKGAELFVPNTSGQIITNRNTEAMMAAQAQPVSINFSIQATDAAGVDEIIASRKNQIVAMVSQAMNQRGKVGLV